MSDQLMLSVECAHLRALVRMRDEEIELLRRLLAARDAELAKLKEAK